MVQSTKNLVHEQKSLALSLRVQPQSNKTRPRQTASVYNPSAGKLARDVPQSLLTRKLRSSRSSKSVRNHCVSKYKGDGA